MGFFSKEDKKPEPCLVKGKEIQCLICGQDQFFERQAQLNTRQATLMGLDAYNAQGICAVCANCGFIHWFLPPD